ncbi:putative ribosomally synthesized peptide with SipW-like signal peptide [Microbacterium terrae]|uniref:SipW-cognate class signal peptide n=1 Tax=Microbacterium terrae TaxID=69369 RepID=A0A0M2H7E0_9MICO|nr:SipW-dependent-type signal peptide-containing protein [Microbacterium terrae]KJL40496.1 hypothetical protein RS81_01580 [Microbacterium terrae]MBP1079179.1 putative ribosomally synthesized peptide with SipW-like signal peptide [Microbacterium terrae]GLJ98580.1 hypothetical protein GCM10017594_17770 [Microbacterium terrae]
MNAQPRTADQSRRTSDRRRIILALVAGGAVLGVGAAITLAVWNDSEFATGTFSSGEFDLEGSTDGLAFSSSPEAPGKELTFALDADALSPDAVVYAPFAVQLSADSDYSAVIDLSNTSAGDIGADLTFSLYQTDEFGVGCSAETPPTEPALVADRAATAADTLTDVFSLTAAATPTNLCFVVTAGPDLDEGATGTVTWEFAGTSDTVLP